MNEDTKLIIDHIEKLAINARETRSESLSSIILGLQRSVKEVQRSNNEIKTAQRKHVELHAITDENQRVQNEKMNDIFTRIEPYIKRSEDNDKFRKDIEEKSKVFTKWGTRWLVLTAVITSLYYGIKHIR